MKKNNAVFYTERLFLRPVSIDDAADLQILAGRKEISRSAINFPYPFDYETAVDWIKKQNELLQNEKGVYCAILLKNENIFIGGAGLTINKVFKNAELGFWIGKEFWGNGYAAEAAAELIKYGLNTLNLNRIFSHHLSSNKASGKVLQKLGMKFEGTFRSHIFHNGRFEDVHNYAILAADLK